MIRYPAKIRYSKNDSCFLVEFPDLPGCLTYGDNLEEAKANAREALTGYLESIDMRRIDIPKPSNLKGKDIYYIEPEKRVAFALWLKTRRLKRGLTQKEMARLLNVQVQSYQKFENPRKANPTLMSITRIEEVLRERVIAV
jgi:antitoxin HicB